MRPVLVLLRMERADIAKLLQEEIAVAQKTQRYIESHTGIKASELVGVLNTAYNEFFADVVQVMADSNNYRFGINQARREGYFPNGGYPFARYAAEDNSEFRNFNAENTAWSKVKKWDVMEPHFVFAPVASWMGKWIAGRDLTHAQRTQVIQATFAAIEEELTSRLAKETPASIIGVSESAKVIKYDRIPELNQTLKKAIERRLP